MEKSLRSAFWNVKDDKWKSYGVVRRDEFSDIDDPGRNEQQSLKIGDEVIVTLHPSKTGAPISTIIKVTKADGSIVVDRITPQ